MLSALDWGGHSSDWCMSVPILFKYPLRYQLYALNFSKYKIIDRYTKKPKLSCRSETEFIVCDDSHSDSGLDLLVSN